MNTKVLLTRHNIYYQAAITGLFRAKIYQGVVYFFFLERLLVQQPTYTQPSKDVVAFYAYLTHKITSPSAHDVLTFDTTITNIGNAYHQHSGIFIAPRAGTYVFTWSFRIQNDAHMSTELVVNNVAVGVVYFDATNGVGGNKAGTAVVHVQEDDAVFIRTSSANNLGDIISDLLGRPYFAGWLLA
jgi:hypothetical protein